MGLLRVNSRQADLSSLNAFFAKREVEAHDHDGEYPNNIDDNQFNVDEAEPQMNEGDE